MAAAVDNGDGVRQWWWPVGICGGIGKLMALDSGGGGGSDGQRQGGGEAMAAKLVFNSSGGGCRWGQWASVFGGASTGVCMVEW
jgi:hypothetical protein